MKVNVKINPELGKDEIIIECKELSNDIKNIQNYINQYGLNMTGRIDKEEIIFKINEVFYFEAVDNRVFAYTADKVLEVHYKIQELNEMLGSLSFIQVSRTVILNIDMIEKLSTLVNGRIKAILINKESMIITRAYSGMFKEKIIERRKN